MTHRNHEYDYTQSTTNGAKSVLTGLLIGGAIGAVTMLLFAPRSGEETRAAIQDKAVELRDRTTATVKDTVAQAKSKAYEIKDTVAEKAEDLKQRGKHIVNRQLDNVAETAEESKKRVNEY